MEKFYRHDHQQYPTTISSPSCASDRDNNTNIFSHGEDNNIYAAATTTSQFHCPIFGGMIDQFDHRHQSGTGFEESSSEICDLIKSQIANHPRYPNLVTAFVECQKVGAPPEMATIFEEISREIYSTTSCSSDRIGADPELDQFMEQYCEVLHRYKEELSKPFDEATTFLNNIQSQLNNLCNGTFTRTSLDYPSDEAAGTSEEEQSYGEGEAPECQESSNSNSRSGDQCHQGGVKGMLMRKYSGHLSSLRKEFLKKRKKGKLPKDARTALLDWWNSHFRWPYPTEEEKAKLSEETGLDQRQINNWFINQRKRHWKPSEDMRFALMDGVTTSSPNYNNDNTGQPVYLDTLDHDDLITNHHNHI